MLCLLFRLDTQRYALRASVIAEVLPLVALTRIAHAPDAIAGVFNFRTTPVPVVDLCQLMLGRMARSRLATRIVLVNYPVTGDPRNTGRTALLGLRVEYASSVMVWNDDAFVPSGVVNPAAPYLDAVARDAHGLIQLIDIEVLLPDAVRSLLFQSAA